MLGKAKGTLQKSKFDQHLVRIKELLSYGLSVRKIARVLGYSSHIALNTTIFFFFEDRCSSIAIENASEPRRRLQCMVQKRLHFAGSTGWRVWEALTEKKRQKLRLASESAILFERK